MKRRKLLAGLGGLGALATLTNCAQKKAPQGVADYIIVEKAKRKMYLFAKGEQIKTYNVALGFAPVGHKQFEGDGKTPEGRYYIHTKNPRSQFHLSLGVSYPNPADYRYAQSQGKKAGGDIFIHGGPTNSRQRARGKDWTAGCIAVTNKEIEEIYALVREGAIIDIRP